MECHVTYHSTLLYSVLKGRWIEWLYIQYVPTESLSFVTITYSVRKWVVSASVELKIREGFTSVVLE
jgi:hypothetical protein